MRLSEEQAALAREYAEGVRVPAEPRDAATVILLRPGDTGPEVYLLRRQQSMAFAAGMAVYPGGGVDLRDSEVPDAAWAGPPPADWAARLGCTEAEARALLCAAVRETFEESGVLLAGSAEAIVSDVSGDDWEADRVGLETRAFSLAELLERRSLVVRTDLLGAWAAWTTPAHEPKRYRTWFFVAALPEGQVTRDVSSESSSVVWLPASDAVAQADAGELMLMPPTYLTCLEVAGHPSPAEVVAAARGRSVEMFTPEVDATGHLSMTDLHRALLEARRG